MSVTVQEYDNVQDDLLRPEYLDPAKNGNEETVKKWDVVCGQSKA